MSPLLQRSALCLAGLAAACGGDGGDVAVDTPNLPPAAAFHGSCAALACTFTDSSTDPDGQIIAYRWAFGDASVGVTTRDASHVYAAPGAYAVSLRVTDDSGATDSVTVAAHAALPPDLPPVAAFSSACDALACVFTDLASDADGQIVAYRWSFGDGSADLTSRSADLTSRSASHTYAAPGTYAVVLTVTDDREESAAVTHTIDVVAPNTPPTAAFGSSCVMLICAFTDSSSDVDGILVGHRWTFGDGGAADAPNPVHTYGAPGVYHVQLTVTDDRGGTGDAAQDVIVATHDHPAIGVSSNALYYCFHPGATRNCVILTRQLRITSSGRPLEWTASASQPWIAVSPDTGTTPTTITVSVAGRLLTPFTSTSGTVTVTATGAVNSPQTVRVTQNYTARP